MAGSKADVFDASHFPKVATACMSDVHVAMSFNKAADAKRPALREWKLERPWRQQSQDAAHLCRIVVCIPVLWCLQAQLAAPQDLGRAKERQRDARAASVDVIATHVSSIAQHCIVGDLPGTAPCKYQ